MNMIAESKAFSPANAAPVAAPAAPSILASRAMLASLNIRQWSARKLDRKVTNDAIQANGAASDAGRFNKALIATESLSGIVAAANAARASHYELTLPWANDGARILSAALHDKYAARMAEHRAAFESALRAFLPEYAALVQESRVRLGAMFNAADYPSESDIAGRFSFGHCLLPVPSGADFRVDIADSQAAAIKADIERVTTAALGAAQRDAWQRVADTVGHMAAKLADFKPGADGARATGIFRDSLVENVRALVDVLPGLNIAADPALAAIAARMAALCAHEADELRASPTIRQQVKSEADSILADVSAFMA